MNIITVISTSYDKLKRLVVKSTLFGKSSNGFAVTPLEISSHGIDSRPIEDARGLYTTTATIGRSYILGYVNADRKAAVGETRLYALSEDGELQLYIWIKNDGTMQIGGDDDNMVRFSELKSGFDTLKQGHNDLVNAFNGHLHGTAAPGAPTTTPTPVPSVIPVTPSTASIDDSKIDEIKTL